MNNFTLNLPCEYDHCYRRGLQKFHAVLDRAVYLNGTWEVGLAEISFTKSVLNIKQRQSCDIIFPTTKKHEDYYRIARSPIYIEAGEYTLESLIHRMNKVISSQWGNDYSFPLHYWDHDEKVSVFQIPMITIENNKVVLRCGQSRQYESNQLFFIYPSEKLCEMLGFVREELLIDYEDICSKYKVGHRSSTDIETIFNDNEKFPAKYVHKAYEKLDHFYVCSDICRPSIYGENFQPILRHVRFDDLKVGSKKTILYDKPHFVRLRKNPFQLIEIRLLKNLNHFSEIEVPELEYDIKFGEIHLVLNFRKISDGDTEYETDPPLKLVKPKIQSDDTFETIVFNPADGAPELPRKPIRP